MRFTVHRNTRLRSAGIALMVGLILAGCAGQKPKTTIAYEERPVDLLYATGAENLDRGRWNEAVAYFKEVERQHPYSEWSRRSMVMTIYAFYTGNRYEDTIATSERFISLYPGSPMAAYAHYMKAVSYFEQIVDVGRDQAATGQAQLALNEVIQRYPTSEYARDARLKLDMVNDQL
ncbi:MAG: outer membrane protein assembly factor BamD, partial [Asticcacaulis sp.]